MMVSFNVLGVVEGSNAQQAYLILMEHNGWFMRTVCR